ncbi:MAG: OmpA family protein [Deltaproteobacteria bacterium]|nr:OmpA family protein [Deltaproteobacteria bacterium]
MTRMLLKLSCAAALGLWAGGGVAGAQEAGVAKGAGAKGAEESNVRYAPTPAGFVGTYRTLAADSAPGGTFRIGVLNEFFKVSNFLVSGDSNTRFTGNLILNVTPIEHFETFLKLSMQSNENSTSSPKLIQVLGDMTIGFKGYFAPIPALTLGASTQIRFLNSTGEASFAGSATSVLLHLLATFDATKLARKFPLRAHFNFGGHIDNSDNLMTTQISSSAVYRYALRINETSRLILALGFDFPLPYVTPFLDWNFEIPVTLGRSNPNGASAFPNTLTIGSRVHPWRDLGLFVGIDIGLTSAGTLGIPAVPGWNLLFGVTYNFDPGRSKVVEKIVEKRVAFAPPATTGIIVGKVTDKASGKPIEGVIVSFPARDTARCATTADGVFNTFEIAAGKIQTRVAKSGYKAEDWDVVVPAGGAATLTVALTAVEPPVVDGGVRGNVVDDAGKPVAGATAELKAPGVDTVNAKVDEATAAFAVKAKPGKYTLAVSANGFVGVERAVEFGSGETVLLDFALKRLAAPAVAATSAQPSGGASVEGNRVVTKDKVQFAGNSTRVSPKMRASLDDVVALLKANAQIKKVRIEAHTDNRGGPKRATRTTQRQADAVKKHLVDAGVAAERLEAKGLGSSKPLVPNLTNRDREKNRRVELVIVE